jgi:hypothetical protein
MNGIERIVANLSSSHAAAEVELITATDVEFGNSSSTIEGQLYLRPTPKTSKPSKNRFLS